MIFESLLSFITLYNKAINYSVRRTGNEYSRGYGEVGSINHSVCEEKHREEEQGR